MVTVTGKLESANGSNVAGSIIVMLCGYGSRVPRDNAVALVARVKEQNITVAADGTFTFSVPPNDNIAPASTYYTVQVKDDNGDTTQINAYRFLSSPPTYDLNLIDPYDPTQPPPPLPPLVTNQLDIVDVNGGAPVFNGAGFTSWKILLTMDVAGASLHNIIAGNLYTFIIVQDAAGGHNFQWPSGPPPANLHNAALVDPAPNSTTVQTFVADDTSDLWPIGPATYYP